MHAFGSLFGKSHPRDNHSHITLEELKQLFPIRNLDEEILETFAAENHTEALAAGSTLFEINQPASCAIYLLDGCIVLSDENAKSYEIQAGSAQAKFPISSGNKHTATAVAKSEITILRVSLNIMLITNQCDHAHINIPETLSGNKLLSLFAEHFESHDYIASIPSLPDIAIKLRHAIEKDVSIDEATSLIQLDAAISAKLIEVANCPLYISTAPIKSCKDAVTRIGLNATRSLVTMLSIKQIFKSHSPIVKAHLEALWKHSLYLSTLCYVLAEHSQQQKPEEALLAGLICDIGAIPFLSFIAELPADYLSDDEIEQAIPIIKGPVGVDVLCEWGFTEEFIDVAKSSSNWFQNTSAELNLTDIVVLARLHTLIGKKTASELPSMTSIPAASKLKTYALSPEHTLALLHDSIAKIHEVLSTFSN